MFPTQVAADVSRRHLKCGKSALTDVGYPQSVNRAMVNRVRMSGQASRLLRFGTAAAIAAVSLLLASAAFAQGTRTVRVTDATAVAGQEVTVPIQLVALGDENALGFSIEFDPALLTFGGALPGSAATSVSLNMNTNQAGSGRVGFALAQPAGQRFAAGVGELVRIRFLAGGVFTNATISFGDSPIVRETVDVSARVLTNTLYQPGTITITPLIAPTIVADPQGATVYAGTNVTFTVTAAGSAPMQFQWQFNGTNVQGATNGVSQTFSCFPAPANLVAWWPGDGSALDVVSTNNGLVYGGVAYTNGMVGQAFSLNGTNAYIEVPDSPNLNPTSSVSVEAWYRPVSFNGNGNNPIVVKPYTSYASPYYQYILGVTGDQYYHDQAEFTFYVALQGGGKGVNTTAGSWIPGRWYHLVGTYDGSSVKLYVNGVLVSQTPGTGSVQTYNQPVLIGKRAYYSQPGVDFTPGTIDEVSIYSQALSPSEITSIYLAGSAGKCRASAATFASTLAITNVSTNHSGNYRAVASNAGGSATSAVAPLVVYPALIPPSITAQPVSRILSAGESVVMSVQATGSSPLSYQWKFGTGILAGETNRTLVLTNVTTAKAGTYSVIVANGAGSATSQNATLAVSATPRTVRIVNGTAATGGFVELGVELVALGEENSLGFSLSFDPARVSYRSIDLGTGAAGMILQVNTNDLPSGRLGVAMTKQAGISFSAGTYSLLKVRFQAGDVSGTNNITFTNTPIATDLADVWGMSRLVSFQDGSIIILSTPPSIVTQPASQTNLIFTSPSLQVVASGSVPLFYQWFFNGAPLAGATSSVLVLNTVTPAKAGNYYVVVTNVVNAVTSAVATVGVQRVVRVVSTNGPTGNLIEVPIELLAAGDENSLGFSLQFDTARLVLREVVVPPLATNLTLYANTNQAWQGMVGIAVAQAPPAIFLAGTQQVARLRFQATALAGAANLTFADTPVARELADANARPRDTAYLNGDITTAHVAPTITQHPASQDVESGARVTFTVAASGSLPMTYQWRMNEGNLASATNSTYVIVNAQPVNSGSYRAEVRNAGGSALSSNAVLNVAPPDTNGPALTLARYGALSLTGGMVISNADTFGVSASDPSGVNRVEFYVDETLIGSDNNGTDGFSAFWNADAFPDGPYGIVFKAYDGRNNLSVLSNSVTLALAPPPAPVIGAPPDGTAINRLWVLLQGMASRYANQVLLYTNGVPTTKTAGIEYSGAFSLMAELTEGTNRLSVAAVNRAGAGPPSAEVRVIVDTSIPPAPSGLEAVAQAGGIIRLSWWAPAGVQVKGYHIFRSPTPFETTTNATRVTTTPVNATSYSDLPAQDGAYYYRAITVNYVDTESPLSAQVNAVSDRVGPRARVDYATTGARLGDRYAAGMVTVTLTVTERLLSMPFLSMVRTNAAPTPITLTAVSDTNYTGFFAIAPGMGTGPAYVNFSARDLPGNRGTEVDSGAVITIDTEGPPVTNLSVTPSSPIRNSITNPVTVLVQLRFNEQDLPAATPVLRYALPATQPAWTLLALASVTNNVWQGTLPLPPTAGVTNELLSFAYEGVDDLGNVSTNIAGQTAFEVYEGELPGLPPPDGLTARALAGGRVELAWHSVAEASDYALFRQAPGEGSLSLQTNIPGVAWLDVPPEGTNRYAVATVRHANSQVSTGSLSTVVSVVADATPPGPPTGVSAAQYGSGIAVYWTRPAGTEPLLYKLYRATNPTNITPGLPPLISNIVSTNALDTHPLAGPSYYAVTAVDALGNESPFSAPAYANISLLPVSSLRVDQHEAGLPVLSWTHGDAAHISGYNVYLGEAGQEVQINGSLLPNTATAFTDTGYDRRERRYTVVAVDAVAGTESDPRSILLPVVRVAPNEGATLKRGVMNRLDFTIFNDSSTAISNVTLGVQVLNHTHWSDAFTVPASNSAVVNVAVGGYPDLPDTVSLTNSIVIVPNPGEQVTVTTTTNLAVGDDLLVVDILNEEFARGAMGNARFALHNTSSEEIEIVTATRTGTAASPDIRFKLTDLDGMVYSTVAVQQFLGAGLVTLPDGTTVARIAPGESFTAALTDVPVPLAAGDEVKLVVEIDQVHYHFGRENHVVMPGLTGSRRISLVDTPYYATVTNIFPLISYGFTNILLAGQVLERGTDVPLARVPMNLVVSLRGFERSYTLYSDDLGNWAYEFTPGESEAGTYSVFALHPSVVARPDQGQFEVRRLFVSPTHGTLRCPRNYAQSITVRASASAGMVVSNLNLAYEAVDQPGGAFPPGISVITNAPITVLGSGQSASLSCAVLGTEAAPASGTIVLRVRSDTPPPGVWGLVTVDYTFVGEAAPALQWTPNFVETGVATSNSVSEQVTLGNVGLADMLGVQVAVVTTNGDPAPAWVFLNSATNLGTLTVGSTKPVSFTFSPDDSVPLSGMTPYLFYLRVMAANHATRDIPLYVHVDRSGAGNVLFKVMDIYTGTLNTNGNLIEGLAGARIRLVKEEGMNLETNLVTDAAGEAMALSLPVGRYSVRVSASGHNDRSDTLWIKPGITVSKDYTLESQLVTVEWSVREITIEDRYEVVLNITYETDVPAPVVVIEPASVSLPDMAPGDVLNGEFTIRNYGLVRAEDVKLTLPPSDQYYKYEVLGTLPTTLEAKQVVRVPYRVTCLSNLEGDEQAGGGGSRTYAGLMIVCYVYKCSNGAVFANCVWSGFFRTTGGGAGSGTVVWHWPTPGGAGGTGGDGPGGGGSFSGGAQSVGGVVCWPVGVWKEILFEADITGLLETLKNILIDVGCSVNCVNRTFMDESVDLSVKVRGGRLEAKRQFIDNAWGWTDNRRLQGAAEVVAQLPRVLPHPFILAAAAGPVYSAVPISMRLPLTHWWDPAPLDPIVEQYNHETYTLTLYRGSSDYYWWLEDKRGNWEHYQADGRLARRGNKRGITAYYNHGLDGGTNVTRVYDQSHSLAFTYEYDASGRITAVHDRTGRRVEYRYTGDRLTEVVDANGQSTSYEYDGGGRMTRKIDAAGRPTVAAYDAQGNVTRVVDRNGNGHFFSFNYDANNGSRYAQIRTSSGMVKEVWYDDQGETRRVDINGRTVQSIAKDWLGLNLMAAAVQFIPATGHTLPGGNLTITDEKGNITRKYRDAWDNVTRIVYPDNSSVSYTYEYRFNQPTRFVDQKGVTYLFDYDNRGNLVRKVEAAGTPTERISQHEYDSWGQLTKAISLADANTEASTNLFAYDSWGNLSYTVNPMGETNYFLACDAAGNPLAIQDARSNVWHFGYDPLGRLTSVTDPLTNVTTYAYDGANNRTNVVNALLKSFGLEYDDHNNLVRTVNPLSKVHSYQYNTDDLPTREIDPDGKELATIYDNEGRVIRTVDGATNQIVYRYDETSATPASSYLPVRIEYPSFNRNLYYDNMQRLVREEDVLGPGTNCSRTFSYDSAGNILSATDAEGKTTGFEYDALNRLVKTTDPAGGTTRRTFDDRGNVVAVEDPNGGITRYQYDRNTRLLRMTRPMGQATGYDYDAAGNCTAILDAKGQKTANEYNAANRLVRRLYFAANDHTNPVKTVTFAYNALGSLVSWDDGTHSAQFTYDDLQRKTSESVNYGTFTPHLLEYLLWQRAEEIVHRARWRDD